MHNPVEVKTNELLSIGGIKVGSSFSVANNSRSDIILGGRRYVVAPNDAEYAQYREAMGAVEESMVIPTPDYSDEYCIVGEIPRDSRTLSQVARGHQPEVGMRTEDVFEKIGITLGRLASELGVVPDPETFSLRDVIILRKLGRTMLLPPLGLIPASPQSVDLLKDTLATETLRQYILFSGGVYLERLIKGFGDYGGQSVSGATA